MPAIRLIKNRKLPAAATKGRTSTVGETSLAGNGNRLLFTGNWYAARSGDGAEQWEHLDPYSFLPATAGGFCCDQTALFVPRHNMFVWLLQYSEDGDTNVMRVATSCSGDLKDHDWLWWDFSPAMVNPQWRNQWFDFNHVTASNNHLYVVSNVFRMDNDAFTRCVVLRIPLASIVAGTGLNLRYFQSTADFSLRCAQGATDTLYMAAHGATNGVLRVWSWPESQNAPTLTEVDISPTNFVGTYSAPGPDGRNWLSRCDERITGGWFARDVIGFMWTGNRMPPARKHPYVRAVRLHADDLSVIDEPDIYSSQWAYAYADACPNAQGVIGVSLFRGGGTQHPGHLVGSFDEANRRWQLHVTRNGSHGPADGKWGDYVGCRIAHPDGNSWIANGFTLQGGSERRNIEPRFVQFAVT